MSDLPPGWDETTTGSLLEFVTSGSRGWAKYYSEQGSVFVRVGNLSRHSISLNMTSVQRVSPPDGAEGQRTRVMLNDILISITADLGRIALITDTRESMYINQHVALARPRPSVNARFLAWYMTSDPVQRQWARLQRGATKLGLGLADIRAIRVPVPPVDEQRRIVAAIEKQLSQLENGAIAVRRIRRNLDRMHAAVLESATRGCLIGMSDASGSQGRDGSSRSPLDWPIVRVSDIAEVSGGITKNPRRQPGANAVPFLRVANVFRDQLDLRDVHKIEVSASELPRFRLRSGDLLVVEGNGSPDQIGRSALWEGSIDPCVHQNHLIRVRPGKEVISEFLNIFWNAPSSRAVIQAAASSTSGLYTLSTGKVKAIRLRLPPLQLQRQIIAEVDRQLSVIAVLASRIAVVEARIDGLRRAILTAAFSGALVPLNNSYEAVSTPRQSEFKSAGADYEDENRLGVQRVRVTT